MSRLNTFLLFFLLLFLFLLIQQSGVLGFSGVRADLLLVGFMCLVALRFSFAEILAFLAALAAYAFLSVPLSFFSFAVFSAIVLLSFFLRRFLTGRFLVDFSLLLLFSTVAFFYALPLAGRMLETGFSFSGAAFPAPGILFIEIVLNAAAAAAVILVGSRTKIASSIL